MSESDGSAICGGTDSLAQEIITASDTLVAVDVPQIKFNFKMVAVDQALKQATDLVERGVRNWQRTNLSIIDLHTHHFQLSYVFVSLFFYLFLAIILIALHVTSYPKFEL